MDVYILQDNVWSHTYDNTVAARYLHALALRPVPGSTAVTVYAAGGTSTPSTVLDSVDVITIDDNVRRASLAVLFSRFLLNRVI